MREVNHFEIYHSEEYQTLIRNLNNKQKLTTFLTEEGYLYPNKSISQDYCFTKEQINTEQDSRGIINKQERLEGLAADDTEIFIRLNAFTIAIKSYEEQKGNNPNPEQLAHAYLIRLETRLNEVEKQAA